MKIGLIQPNVIPGDFSRNVRTLIEHYRNCLDQGASLVIAPAQSLCGPRPGDLVFRSGFNTQNLAALNYLSTELGEAPLLVGTICHYEDEEGNIYADHVTCIITREGQEELTEFSEGDIVELNGINIGIVRDDRECGAFKPGACDLILRLTAQPWYAGKFESDLAADQELSQSAQCAVARVSLVGGQERDLYGGGSTLVNAQGDLLKRLAIFEDDSHAIDTDSVPVQDPLPVTLEQTRKAIVMGIRDFIRKSGFSSVCLGLSGGIDSALVAALAVEALGPGNVHGLALPSPYSSQGSLDDAYALARNLGMECHTIPITPAFEALKHSMGVLFEGTQEDLTEENMQSRLRGVILMSYSNKFNHLLLSTGNKSEASVGFCTMYGDTCGAMLPIGDLYKTEVYALSNHINNTSGTGERIPANTINKAPSAELRPGQVDQDSLPPYEILDAILRELVDHNRSASEVIGEGRFEEATVRRVQRLLKISEWKREQAPPIPAVSLYAYGPGRDIPAIHRLND